MQDPLRLFTAAGNKKPKWSLSGYDTASSEVFAWCFLAMGWQRGKTVSVVERNGIGEYTPKFHGEGDNQLQQ